MRQIFDELIAYQLTRYSSLADAVRLAKEYMDGGQAEYTKTSAKLPKSLRGLFDTAIATRIRDGYDLLSSIEFVSGLMPESEFDAYESAIADFEAAPTQAKTPAKKAD